jgi:hypothetical protein
MDVRQLQKLNERKIVSNGKWHLADNGIQFSDHHVSFCRGFITESLTSKEEMYIVLYDSHTFGKFICDGFSNITAACDWLEASLVEEDCFLKDASAARVTSEELKRTYKWEHEICDKSRCKFINKHNLKFYGYITLAFNKSTQVLKLVGYVLAPDLKENRLVDSCEFFAFKSAKEWVENKVLQAVTPADSTNGD